MKRQKSWLMITGVLLAIGLIVAGIIAITANSAEAKLAEQLELGQKYLDEMNYEQAIIAYETAIEIDPKCEEAYLALAEVYVQIENYEAAAAILNRGIEECGSVKLSARQEELQLIIDAATVREATVKEATPHMEDNNYLDEDNEMEIDLHTHDVIDYLGKWSEMTEELNMVQFSKEHSLGNVYEVGELSIDIASSGYIQLSNHGYQDISIGGVVLGDERLSAKSILENGLWMCSYSNEDFDYYVMKKDDNYYYLYLYLSDQKDRIDSWYLSNWNDEEFAIEECIGYDTYISVSEGWKKEYIKLIVNKGFNYDLIGSFIEKYKLVDINGDHIPELYINFGSTAEGDMICSYYNNSVIYQYMWNYGFSYIEGQNLFRDAGGHMDVYHDKIYSLENDEFVLLYDGEYGALSNSNVQYDSEGLPLYDYYWNGIQVSSEEEYQRLLRDVYDVQRASNPYDNTQFDNNAMRYVGNGICDFEEILQAIAAY